MRRQCCRSLSYTCTADWSLKNLPTDPWVDGSRSAVSSTRLWIATMSFTLLWIWCCSKKPCSTCECSICTMCFSIQIYLHTLFFNRFLQVSDQSHPSVSFGPRPARRCGRQWQTKLDPPCRPPLQHGCVPAHSQQGLQHAGPKGNLLDTVRTIQWVANVMKN